MKTSTLAMSASSRRKSLGQYLTGVRLARVLAMLSRADHPPGAVADPMCGTGDMLVAARDVFGPGPKLVGVDIDDLVISSAMARLKDDPAMSLVHANAFDPANWAGLDWPVFDLVITNPPYVRYQTLARAMKHGLPDAGQVREGLRQIVQLHPRLAPDDRAAFVELIDHYSGLADLAVPAWIL